jgi:hypothetical protein
VRWNRRSLDRGFFSQAHKEKAKPRKEMQIYITGSACTTKNYQVVLDEILFMASNEAWFDSINRA